MQLLLPRGDYEVGEEGEVKMGESGDLSGDSPQCSSLVIVRQI